MIDTTSDPGIRRDPYLILLRQATRRHRDALAAADMCGRCGSQETSHICPAPLTEEEVRRIMNHINHLMIP